MTRRTPPSSADPPKRLMTVDEVAHRLNISSKSVRRRIGEGTLVINRVGRSVRVSEESLQIYLRHTTR